MEKQVVEKLNALNRLFYAEQGDAFSSTRTRPWEGWTRVAERIGEIEPPAAGSMRILDVGCGNMRFERFLDQALPQKELAYTCLDTADGMVVEAGNTDYVHFDIVESIVEGGGLKQFDTSPFDAAVAFGLLHHVPGYENRCELLSQMASCVRTGGIVAVSLWRYLDDENMAKKARRIMPEALQSTGLCISNLDNGDGFLGWSDAADAYRYCHSFDDREIDSLIANLDGAAELIDRYKADSANEYLVFRVF